MIEPNGKLLILNCFSFFLFQTWKYFPHLVCCFKRELFHLFIYNYLAAFRLNLMTQKEEIYVELFVLFIHKINKYHNSSACSLRQWWLACRVLACKEKQWEQVGKLEREQWEQGRKPEQGQLVRVHKLEQVLEHRLVHRST